VRALTRKPPERSADPFGTWFGEHNGSYPVDPNESFKSVGSVSPTAYPLDYRRTILKATLHVADVSNPSRPSAVCVRWADLVQEEFFRQGDQEAQLGLPVSMFMDRSKPAFPKMQVGFIEFIVRPLLEAYWGWLRSFKPVAEPLLLSNIEYWKRKQVEAGDAGPSTSSPSVSTAAATIGPSPLGSPAGASAEEKDYKRGTPGMRSMFRMARHGKQPSQGALHSTTTAHQPEAAAATTALLARVETAPATAPATAAARGSTPPAASATSMEEVPVPESAAVGFVPVPPKSAVKKPSAQKPPSHSEADSG
jgi:hypothetical protein